MSNRDHSDAIEAADKAWTPDLGMNRGGWDFISSTTKAPRIEIRVFYHRRQCVKATVTTNYGGITSVVVERR